MATARILSARDWRAAEALLQVPAFARSGVDHAKGRRRSGDRENPERSQPASQLARSGVDHSKGRRRSGDRENPERSRRGLSAENLLALAWITRKVAAAAATARILSARDWRAAEALLQVPAFARMGVHRRRRSAAKPEQSP